MSQRSPKIYFDEDGSIICSSFEGNFERKKKYTCLDCEKYLTHLCEFGAVHAEKVLNQLYYPKFGNKCGLCGNVITDYWTLLYYRYLKFDQKIQTIPLCCSCYIGLKNNHWENIRKNKKDLIKSETLNAFGCIFLGFLIIARSIFMYDFILWLGILITLVGAIIIGLGIKNLIQSIENRIYLKKALRLYKYLSRKENNS